MRKKYELAQWVADRHLDIAHAGSRIAILSDFQIPFEDVAAIEQALEVVASVRPDTVILNGDIVDCYAESVFMKDWKLAVESIPQAHTRARRLMECFEEVPNKIWMGGNHEERWKKELWREIAKGDKGGTVALNLAAMSQEGKDGIDLRDPVGSFERLYDMAAHGFRYLPYHSRLNLAEGNLLVTHGEYVRKDAGAAARATFEAYGKSVIVGHTHRMGSYFKTQRHIQHGGWEGGCLCNLEPEWVTSPNWQQGLVVVEINGPEFHVVPVPIVRHTRGGKPMAAYRGLEASL